MFGNDMMVVVLRPPGGPRMRMRRLESGLGVEGGERFILVAFQFETGLERNLQSKSCVLRKWWSLMFLSINHVANQNVTINLLDDFSGIFDY